MLPLTITEGSQKSDVCGEILIFTEIRRVGSEPIY